MLSNNNFSFFFSQGLIIISSSWYSSLRRDKRVDHSEKKERNEKNLRLNICNKDFMKFPINMKSFTFKVQGI